MKRALYAAMVAILSTCLLPCLSSAQSSGSRAADDLEPLPPGTYLPVTLHRSLRAGRTHVGTRVEASTTQRVPLAAGRYLRAGARLSGSVVQSTASPAVLVFQFDRVDYHGATQPIAVRALAAANFIAMSDTRRPANGSTDRGNSNPANWTTEQVGGDQVVRSGWSGPVINQTTQTVGFADFDGVYLLPAETGGVPRALGVFSTGARGLFGYSNDCSLVADPVAISLRCAHSALVLRNGDNLLLEVLSLP